MKHIFLLFICIPFIAFAQDYQLDFNSTNMDYVEIANASSVIANKTAFSISGCVNPQIANSHNGLFGFRDNTTADFYLLQLQNTNNIEARFRNSAGVTYDVLGINVLDIGQWQHLAFTYDGAYLRLYKNGILIDSTAASGMITQTTQSFKLGSLDWAGTGFYMNGSLDEIRLWDDALSQSVINTWICTPIDLTHPNYNNLMGYWRLNDGNGTFVADASFNSLHATLYNAIWTLSTSCFGSTTSVLKTYVPDDNFEQWLIVLGYDNVLDDSVITANINSVTSLNLWNQNISDLTGIEDFTALVSLDCVDNLLTHLDVSQNTALDTLFCGFNQLTTLDISGSNVLRVLGCGTNQIISLDVSNNTLLTHLVCDDNLITNLDISNNDSLNFLDCSFNQLTNLNVSQNTSLIYLYCSNNQITSLNVSNNIALTHFYCTVNQLTYLDLRNGSNILLDSNFNCRINPNLSCINVDDSTWATNIWTVSGGRIDPQHYFSNNCSGTTSIEEGARSKELLKVTDLVGRKTKGTKNQPLLHIYDDGTVEKKIIIE